MKNHHLNLYLTIGLIVGLFLPILRPTPALAQAPTGSPLRLVTTDEGSLTLELTVADFSVETVTVGDQTYQRLQIPGLIQNDRPGTPQVPTYGTWLGLPTTDGVSVEVIEADIETLPGSYHVAPAPTQTPAGDTLDALLAEGVQTTYQPDPAIYEADAFYPAQPATIATTALMRDQPAAQVQFFPVQVNPVSGETRLYRRLVVRLNWAADGLSPAAAPAASPAYESLLEQTLLNYDSLSRPPRLSPPPSAPALAPAADDPALKIGVTEDGLYQLTHTDLTQAGFSLSGVDPRQLKLTAQGSEVPLYLPGEGDGVFDAGDVMLFYGTAISDSIYTAENVYWLTVGQSNGQRITSRAVPPGGATVPTEFPTTLHLEENTFYWQTMPDGEGQDHWFWGERLNAPKTQTYTFTLTAPSTTVTTGTLRARMKGRTDIPGINPDHHTKLYLNGVDIEPAGQFWDGLIVYDHEADFDHTLLQAGENEIKLELVGDTGAATDQVYHNWFELDYWDTYVAVDDRLAFGGPSAGTYQFEISNFSSDQIDLFDISDPANVVRLTGAVVTNSGPTTHTLTFEDAAQATSRYLALTQAQRRTPARLELDEPSAWQTSSLGADYIIITHEDFYDNVQPLVAHRMARGLRVATVKVEDIYDEFNHGIFDPQAIRDFLTYAYANWQSPAPTYVMLIGDAYQDYKDYLQSGTINYVPTQIIETDLLGQTPSDNWFVLTSGDDLVPDMFIGRLSAQSRGQVDDIVAKIITYEENSDNFTWNKNTLLVADDESVFESISEQLSDLLPYGYTAQTVYANNYPPGDPTTDIRTALDGGSLFLSYAGHGNVERWGSWADGFIFHRDDVSDLENTNKLPLVTVANCLNGFFSGPQTQVSFAEEFLRLKERGAVAVWAPTALNYPSGHRALMLALYSAVFDEGQYELGAATNAAKIGVSGQNSVWDELIETYVLFGDPAMELSHTSHVYLPLVIKEPAEDTPTEEVD